MATGHGVWWSWRRQSTQAAVVVALLVCTQPVGLAAPPFSGTIFLDPDIITASDPNAFAGIAAAGTGARVMFDRRPAAFVTYTAFLFNATYSDLGVVEVQVNPEFGSAAAAGIEAEKYARAIGHLPAALRRDVRTVWIHAGVHDFGGGNNNLLIHTGRGAEYIAAGILEETFVHEATHTSIDADHRAAAGWLASQAADIEFISTYARDNPTREDLAETFLPYLAVRHRASRISASLRATIEATIPNRLTYLDQQGFDLSPFVSSTGSLVPPSMDPPVVAGTTVTAAWLLPAGAVAPGGFQLEAGSGPGLANLATVTLATSQRAITFTSVPNGTYYLRIRSLGPGGASAPSNEVTVVVGGAGGGPCVAPAVPQQLTAAVAGSQVTFAWQLPGGGGALTAFVLEAGSATGLANLATLDIGGSQRSFAVTAPPGQFFIRIRARGCTVSPPSNEIVVTVP